MAQDGNLAMTPTELRTIKIGAITNGMVINAVNKLRSNYYYIASVTTATVSNEIQSEDKTNE